MSTAAKRWKGFEQRRNLRTPLKGKGMEKDAIVLTRQVESLIFIIRGQRVMIDEDLAALQEKRTRTQTA